MFKTLILYICNPQEFAQQAEMIFRGSDRRTELDKAYVELTATIFDVNSYLCN
jgi:hypothetical protein